MSYASYTIDKTTSNLTLSFPAAFGVSGNNLATLTEITPMVDRGSITLPAPNSLGDPYFLHNTSDTFSFFANNHKGVPVAVVGAGETYVLSAVPTDNLWFFSKVSGINVAVTASSLRGLGLMVNNGTLNTVFSNVRVINAVDEPTYTLGFEDNASLLGVRGGSVNFRFPSLPSGFNVTFNVLDSESLALLTPAIDTSTMRFNDSRRVVLGSGCCAQWVSDGSGNYLSASSSYNALTRNSNTVWTTTIAGNTPYIDLPGAALASTLLVFNTMNTPLSAACRIYLGNNPGVWSFNLLSPKVPATGRTANLVFLSGTSENDTGDVGVSLPANGMVSGTISVNLYQGRLITQQVGAVYTQAS